MAKTSPYAAPKPIYRDGGYTGILFFTILAIAVGIGLLAMEYTEDYDGNSEGTGTPAALTVKSLIDSEKKSTTPAPAPPVEPPMAP